MNVKVAVLKEMQPHERRVAMVSSIVAKLVKLGAGLHMQSGAGDAIKLADTAFNEHGQSPATSGGRANVYRERQALTLCVPRRLPYHDRYRRSPNRYWPPGHKRHKG
jgi:alanine dehydrogenase